MDAMQAKANLAKKLVKILGELQTIKKSGRNDHQGYQYTTESDLLEVIRPRLVEQGVFVFSSVESQEVTPIEDGNKKTIITSVTTVHTFVDSESGAEFSVKSQGQGADKQDKGVYKAITGATKYFLWKNFLMETGDDPENDGANPSYIKAAPVKHQTKQIFSSPVIKDTPEKPPEEVVEVKQESQAIPVKVKETPKRNWSKPPLTPSESTKSAPTVTQTKTFVRQTAFMGHAGEPKF